MLRDRGFRSSESAHSNRTDEARLFVGEASEASRANTVGRLNAHNFVGSWDRAFRCSNLAGLNRLVKARPFARGASENIAR